MAIRGGTPPSYRDIKNSVFRGLHVRQGLTGEQVVGITFSPTLGIAAGRIAKLGVDIRSFRVPLSKAIKEVVIPSIQKNFDEGGRPEWEPLSEETVKLREHAGYDGTTPLVRTGRLQKTMKQFNIWTITSTMAILADLPQDVWYGKVHQGGYEGMGTGRRARLRGSVRDTLEAIVDTASPGRVVPAIPARPFVVLQPEDEDRITEIFIEWLEMRVMAAWPGVLIKR